MQFLLLHRFTVSHSRAVTGTPKPLKQDTAICWVLSRACTLCFLCLLLVFFAVWSKAVDLGYCLLPCFLHLRPGQRPSPATPGWQEEFPILALPGLMEAASPRQYQFLHSCLCLVPHLSFGHMWVVTVLLLSAKMAVPQWTCQSFG